MWELQEEWLKLLNEWIAYKPIDGNPCGLAKSWQLVERELITIGFEVQKHFDPKNKSAQPVLVAIRKPMRGNLYVGLFNHYDIEREDEGWDTDPFQLTMKNDRLYARGIGDNIGPFALRLISLRNRMTQLPGMVWVIHGEEEIGSPWAHELFPIIKDKLPPVCMWIEETGYFENDGTQRILAKNFSKFLQDVISNVEQLAKKNHRATKIEERYLNKAFGDSKCPCLTHLVGNTPYLGIGPNDDKSTVHSPNESLPLDTLSISSEQFLNVLELISTG